MFGKKLAEAPNCLRADGVLSSVAKSMQLLQKEIKITLALLLPNTKNRSHKYHW